MESILLDTSFCIRLVKPDDPYHNNVKGYYEYFIEKKIKMYLSPIVVSEFCIKDSHENLPLQTTRFIPFGFDDAISAGQFESVVRENKSHTEGMSRIVVRNDCKLIAQIATRGIQGYITGDKKSFKKIIEPIKGQKGLDFKVIDLTIPLSDWLASERGGLFQTENI